MKHKKILSFILATAMTISLLPTFTLTALAEEYTGTQYETTGLYYTKYDDHCEITDCDTSVTSVTIPETIDNLPVTSIGNRAFYQCAAIEAVVIPESIKTISLYAFYECLNLADIKILNDNVQIKEAAFEETAYYTNDSNWEDNILYIGKHLIEVKYNVSGEVTIKDGTTTIAEKAFERKTNITKINFPNSLLRITEYAFNGCTNLQNITIPTNVTAIEKRAFYGCTKLESITIPESVTEIGDYAFGSCTGLKSVTINSESMGKYMFDSCTYLTDVTFGNEVKSVGYEAFYGCGMESIEIPAHIEKIDVNAFRNCSKLKNISILNDNIEIGDWAFTDCSSLTNIDFLPKTVTSIGYGWFGKCTGLTDVTIPERITSIGASAFYGCSNLTNLTLHDDITNIGTDAFYGCGFSSITLPKGIKSISDRMFMACKKLTSLDIPKGVTSIGFAAFSSCEKMESINIPNSVTSIGKRAFFDCKSLKNVVIPDGITNIEADTFWNCKNLTSIVIPKTVASIGNDALGGCPNLVIDYKGTETEWNAITKDSSDTFSKVNYNCVPKTITTISGNTFTVTGNYIDGCTVILALYKDDGQGNSQLVDCKTAVYSGTPIPFITTATDYTSAKVMVWKDLETLEPVTEVEIVNLG